MVAVLRFGGGARDLGAEGSRQPHHHQPVHGRDLNCIGREGRHLLRRLPRRAVTHFDRGRESFVIFEDLYRFDDPAIFDSLRELNTILNSSSRRKTKTAGKPLRFVYAIRDSLFERINDSTTSRTATGAGQADTPAEPDPGYDGTPGSASAPYPTAAEDPPQKFLDGPDKRANRTKFFDFLSR